MNWKINYNKSNIYNCKEGVVFLGIHYKIINNRLVSYLPSAKKRNIRKKIKQRYKAFFSE